MLIPHYFIFTRNSCEKNTYEIFKTINLKSLILLSLFLIFHNLNHNIHCFLEFMSYCTEFLSMQSTGALTDFKMASSWCLIGTSSYSAALEMISRSPLILVLLFRDKLKVSVANKQTS